MIRLNYTPLLRQLQSDNFSSQNKNTILGGVITYVPKTKKAAFQFNVLYNYYFVNTDTQKINFQNFSYYHQVSFKNNFKTGLNLSWYKNNLKDSLSNNVLLGVLDAGYQFKNGSSFTLAGKSAYKIHKGFYPGFIVKGSLKVYKNTFWEGQVEKFIVGDLFNGYDLQNLKQFPYYCTTRIIYNF